MTYSAKILADSISEHGDRLTTFEITLPRIMLSEFNTHRSLSRNSASSRAVPVSISIKDVESDPFIPEVFGSHQKGMVEGEPLNEDQQNFARHLWIGACDAALDYASGLEQLGVYKGLANRLLEPFKWHTIIATATDWDHFFALRTAPSAQAEIRKAASMMRELYDGSTPTELGEGRWHLPLVSSQELLSDDHSAFEDYEYWIKVSVGRCARVSYNRQHDGSDPDSDVARHDSLKVNYHLSPFEHVARPFDTGELSEIQHWQKMISFAQIAPQFKQNMQRNLEYAGNLRGWWSARMDLPNQDSFQKVINSSPE